MATSTETYIEIGLAERMLNEYDGNKANLHVFIDNCNNAYKLLNPNYRVAFVSVILSKIKGNVRSTLLNRSFNSWEDLKQHLLENHSERRTFAQWQLELNSCRQGHNESISSYSNRIENCYIKLIKSLDPKLSKEARNANIELLKNQALNIFISGLNPQLHILLKSQKPATFEEAVSIAISEEQEIKSRQEMTSRHFDQRQKRCTQCQALGHLAFQCRKNPVIRSMQTDKIPVCFNCNKKGHMARDCWHKHNTNNRGPPSPNNYSQNYKNNSKNNFQRFNSGNRNNSRMAEPSRYVQESLNSTGPKTAASQRTM